MPTPRQQLLPPRAARGALLLVLAAFLPLWCAPGAARAADPAPPSGEDGAVSEAPPRSDIQVPPVGQGHKVEPLPRAPEGSLRRPPAGADAAPEGAAGGSRTAPVPGPLGGTPGAAVPGAARSGAPAGERAPLPASLWAALLGAAVFAGAVAALALRRRAAAAAPPRAAPAQPAPADDESLLAGKYALVRLIAKGRGGEVWEAQDRSLQRAVAVKKLSFAPEARAALLQQVQAAASVRHPNVAEVFEILDSRAGLYVVLELLTGKSIRQLLVERRRFTLEQAKQVLRPVSAGLEFAHSCAVVHRGLKPSDIQLTDEGYVKILDLGCAQDLSGAAGVYAAPEAIQGVVSPAADVYSLGVCLYEMVAGEFPLRGTGRGREYVKAVLRVPGLNPAFDELIQGCLDPDPAKRPAGARGFASALEALA